MDSSRGRICLTYSFQNTLTSRKTPSLFNLYTNYLVLNKHQLSDMIIPLLETESLRPLEVWTLVTYKPLANIRRHANTMGSIFTYPCEWLLSYFILTAIGAGRDVSCFTCSRQCWLRTDNVARAFRRWTLALLSTSCSLTLTVRTHCQGTHLSSLCTKVLENQPGIHTVTPGVS